VGLWSFDQCKFANTSSPNASSTTMQVRQQWTTNSLNYELRTQSMNSFIKFVVQWVRSSLLANLHGCRTCIGPTGIGILASDERSWSISEGCSLSKEELSLINSTSCYLDASFQEIEIRIIGGLPAEKHSLNFMANLGTL